MLSRCDRIAEDPHYRKGEPVRDLFARDREAMAPMPGTRFDACRWEVRKADGEGCVSVDSHRYLAGPSWRGWTLDVGLRAFDVEIRTRDGRRIGKLPRAYGGDTGTVRDPAVLLPALARKPRAWGESPIRADFPDRLRLSIDAMESRERQRTLRLIHRASESAGFDAAARAAERLVEQGHGIDEASLMTLARRIAAGETPYDEPAPDPRRLRPVHAAVRRPEGGMMTKPGTAQPDTRRRRASTGQLMDGIMGLARRLPLTRQVLADQLETATPAQMEFMHAWMNAEIDSRERSKRARLLKQAGFPQTKTLDGYDRVAPALPRRLRAAGIGIPRLRRAHGGRGHVRPSRHRQDPPGHRAGPAGLPGGRTDPVLHRRRARHATTARQRGEQARPGALPDRQGQAPGRRRARIHPDRRGRQPPPVPGRHQRVRKTEHRPRPPTSSSADGAGSSATPTRHAACQSTAPSTTAG